MVLLYGRAGRLTAKHGGFRPRRAVCDDTVYDKENGGNWSFLPGTCGGGFKVPLPATALEFYSWFFAKGVAEGMVAFEPDFMNVQAKCIPEFTVSATAQLSMLFLCSRPPSAAAPSAAAVAAAAAAYRGPRRRSVQGALLSAATQLHRAVLLHLLTLLPPPLLLPLLLLL